MNESTPNRDELILLLDGLQRLLTSEYHPGLAIWRETYGKEVAKLLAFFGAA